MKKWRNLILYNHYGNGDLFDSRNFALAWIQRAKPKAAFYAMQPKYFGCVADLPQLQPIPLNGGMLSHKSWEIIGGDLHVNTWIGRGWNSAGEGSGGYVLSPGVGCVLERIHQMHGDMLRDIGLPPLSNDLLDYIPSIDYGRVNLGALPAWVREQEGKQMVLICNGPTTSNQSTQRDYAECLNWLPFNEQVLYLFTQRTEILDQFAARPDVVATDTLTRRGVTGWDLAEVSYLSRFCVAIVGRCSGPHMFSQVKENWLDPGKKLVCFTRHRNGACFIRDPERLGLKMEVVWSDTDDPREMAAIIRRCL